VEVRAQRPDTLSSVGLAGAVAAMLAWGASGVIAKAIDMPGLAVAVYRFWLSSAVFLAYLAVAGAAGARPAMTLAKVKVALPGAVCLAFDVAFFFSAVKLTTIANATVVGALQPLLMMLLGHRLLGERLLARQVLWALAALVGVALLVYSSSGQPQWSLAGDLLAFGALFAWTGYLFFSKSTQGRVSPLEYTAITGLVAALVNTVLAVALAQDLSWPSTRSWTLLVAMALGSGLCAHLLMNWSLTRIPVWVGSTTSLLIPGGAAVMAWAVLAEPITRLQAAGITLTLLSLLAVTRSGRADRTRSALAPVVAADQVSPQSSRSSAYSPVSDTGRPPL
jgi:drug/metabolite transporter (DMT)-like permease